MNPVPDKIGRWACLGAFVAGLLAAPLWAQPTIAITSPRDGVVVRPGSNVTITVAVSPPRSFRTVIILPEDSLNAKGSLMLNSPPYRFTLEIPRDIQVAGRYGIGAAGVLANGTVDCDPVVIDVERSDPPVQIEAALRSLIFASVGESGNLLIYGVFADGSKLDLTRSSLTKYTSGSQAIVKVNKNGLATATGPGSTSITVENNGAKIVIPASVPYERAPGEGKMF